MGTGLTLAEEAEVVARARAGDEGARERLVAANSGLLWGMARRYRSDGMESADLLGEAVVGLFRAVEDWEPKRGVRFHTYAFGWVRHAVSKARQNKAPMVRMPQFAAEKWARVLKAREELAAQGDDDPLGEEVARRAGVTEAELTRLDTAAHILSLDCPLNEEGDLLGDMVAHGGRDFVEPLVCRLAVREALASLKPALRLTVELRFGLDGNGERSLEEVGRALGITREGVRHRLAKAFGLLQQRFEE